MQVGNVLHVTLWKYRAQKIAKNSPCFTYAGNWVIKHHSVVCLLWLPCIADVDVIYLSCGFFFYILSFFLTNSEPSQTGCLPYFYTWCGLSANLGCRSQTCCMRLAENTGQKIRHLGTIAQLRWAISSKLRHISTIGKKLVRQQYLPTSLLYGELRPTSGWFRFISLWHPSKFQQVSRLGSVTARHSTKLRHWTEGATYIRQGGHHIGNWPTFSC